jgi:hypothetical protein
LRKITVINVFKNEENLCGKLNEAFARIICHMAKEDGIDLTYKIINPTPNKKINIRRKYTFTY